MCGNCFFCSLFCVRWNFCFFPLAWTKRVIIKIINLFFSFPLSTWTLLCWHVCVPLWVRLRMKWASFTLIESARDVAQTDPRLTSKRSTNHTPVASCATSAKYTTPLMTREDAAFVATACTVKNCCACTVTSWRCQRWSKYWKVTERWSYWRT